MRSVEDEIQEACYGLTEALYWEESSDNLVAILETRDERTQKLEAAVKYMLDYCKQDEGATARYAQKKCREALKGG